MEEDSNETVYGYTCRICLDETERFDVIAPCLCSGSSKWIHRSCLDKWRCTKENAFSKCTECLAPYQLQCLSGENTERASFKRQIRFICYIIKDLLIALLVTQTIIIIFGLLAYSIDKKDHTLEKQFHFESHPILFYYLVGLVVVLAMIGMSYSMCYQNNCNTVSPGPCFCDCPYCLYMGPSDVPLCPGCNCAGVNCTECACCNSCDGAGCMACDCSGLGAEAAGLLLVLLAIFAFIGLFISIFAGIVFTQYIVRKHLHFLGKRTMAEDYIVKDLASDAFNIVRTVDKVNEEDNVQDTSFNPISTMHNSQRYARVEGIEMNEMNRGLDEEDSRQIPDNRQESHGLSREHQLVLIRHNLI